MKKVISGLVLIVFGCITFVVWWHKFLQIIQGIIPVICVVIGMMVLSAGIRAIEREKIKNKTGIKSAKAKLSPDAKETENS